MLRRRDSRVDLGSTSYYFALPEDGGACEYLIWCITAHLIELFLVVFSN